MTEVTVNPTAIESPNARAKMSRFAEAMKTRAGLDKPEGDEAKQSALDTSAQIAERILSAESVDDIFDAMQGGALGGRDLIGVEQRVFGIEVRQGDDEELANPLFGGTYLLVSAMKLEDGSEIPWNTSATNLYSALVALERRDAFPIDLVIRATEKGKKTILRFEKLAKRAI